MKTPSDAKEKLPFYHSAIQWLAHLWMIAFIASFFIVMKTGSILLGVSLAYVVNSLFTILLYWDDKHCAKNSYWRIPELVLHLWELLCGWPGALIAQKAFKHKGSKVSFLVVFWLCLIVNVIAVGSLIYFGYSADLGTRLNQWWESIVH